MIRLRVSVVPSLPVGLAALAALSVVVTLAVLRRIDLTLALYHLGICLLLPLCDSLWGRHLPLSGHLRLIGLAGPGAGAGIAVGLVMLLLFGGATYGALSLARGWLLDGPRIAAALAEWGVPPESMRRLSLLLVAGNGAAEELFWRGWVQGRLRATAGPGLAIGLTTALFTVYHVYTLERLVGGGAALGLSVLAVALASVTWGWLRELTGSVWPPLLAHSAATAAYLGGYWRWLAPAAG